MEILKDFFDVDINVGDTAVVADSYGGRLLIGKVTHYSRGGSAMLTVIADKERRWTWTRTITPDYASSKVVITRDPRHLNVTEDIKVKGEWNSI